MPKNSVVAVLTLAVLLVSVPVRAQDHQFFVDSKSDELISMLLVDNHSATEAQLMKKMFAVGYVRALADLTKGLGTIKLPADASNDDLADAVIIYAAKHLDSVDQMPASTLVCLALNAKYGVEEAKPASAIRRTPKVSGVHQIPKSETH